MDRGNSRENEGIQRRIVAKLHIFWGIYSLLNIIVRIYIEVIWQLWTWYVQKQILWKSHSKVTISKVELSELNHVYSFFISWEEAATWSYTCYASPKMFTVKKKNFFFNLKACLFYATRIFKKLWNPNHLSCACAFSTFRYMIRKIVTSSFSTVEKLLEAAKNLSSNVSPQIISNSASLKSRRK